MTFELAKKLKDAGFPQGKYAIKPLEKIPTEFHEDALSAPPFVPTLSELIEECYKLSSFEIKIWETEDGRFRAVTNLDDGNGNEIDFWLSSLEEVFALLWLDLKLDTPKTYFFKPR